MDMHLAWMGSNSYSWHPETSAYKEIVMRGDQGAQLASSSAGTQRETAEVSSQRESQPATSRKVSKAKKPRSSSLPAPKV